MKILGILGSPRSNGNTALLLNAALDAAAQAGAEIEKVGVAGLELNYCIACGKCYATGKCIYNDGASMLQAKMMEADGIVLGIPNYFMNMPAQLKVVFDRFSLGVHCFLLDGKYGASVTTAGGVDDAEVAEIGNRCLRACGAQTVGAVGAQGAGCPGAVLNQDDVLTEAAEVGKRLVEAIQAKTQYPEQMEAHKPFSEHMKHLVTVMAEHAPYQLEYWQKKGWL